MLTKINERGGGTPERKIRRKSGEQDVILAATGACSKTEWLMLLAGLGLVDPEA
jgi:hypothetical protein